MDAGKGKQETGDERRENEMRDGRRVTRDGRKEMQDWRRETRDKRSQGP